MGRLSSKLRSVRTNLGDGVAFWCPGCDTMHGIAISGRYAWAYDGNPDAPTFSPSILVSGTALPTDDEYARIMAGEHVPPRHTVCHSFVRAGRIEFLIDCTHALRGQTVDLPDLPGAGE